MSKKPVPHLTMLAIAALVGSLSQAAHAEAINLLANSGASANGVSSKPFANSSAGYVSSYSYAFDGQNSGSGSAFSKSNGAYAVSSSANATGAGLASTSLTFSFTNTGAAQNFSANFHLYGGSVGTSVNSALAGAEVLKSSYLARILVGGMERFQSSAQLTTTASGSSLATKGTVLNAADDGSDGFYSWDAIDLALDLGLLGTGETIDILAELSSASMADVGTYSYDCGGGGGYEGYITFRAASTVVSGGDGDSSSCEASKGSTSVFYGDPLTIDGGDDGSNAPTPDNQGVVVGTGLPNQVPEPGALALVGLALAGLGWTRRRTR